jgi:hypothetical protein
MDCFVAALFTPASMAEPPDLVLSVNDALRSLSEAVNGKVMDGTSNKGCFGEVCDGGAVSLNQLITVAWAACHSGINCLACLPLLASVPHEQLFVPIYCETALLIGFLCSPRHNTLAVCNAFGWLHPSCGAACLCL